MIKKNYVSIKLLFMIVKAVLNMGRNIQNVRRGYVFM